MRSSSPGTPNPYDPQSMRSPSQTPSSWDLNSMRSPSQTQIPWGPHPLGPPCTRSSTKETLNPWHPQPTPGCASRGGCVLGAGGGGFSLSSLSCRRTPPALPAERLTQHRHRQRLFVPCPFVCPSPLPSPLPIHCSHPAGAWLLTPSPQGGLDPAALAGKELARSWAGSCWIPSCHPACPYPVPACFSRAWCCQGTPLLLLPQQSCQMCSQMCSNSPQQGCVKTPPEPSGGARTPGPL